MICLACPPEPPSISERSAKQTGAYVEETVTGVESGEWGSYRYQRHCTDEELALLEAEHRLDQLQRLDEARKKRDQWFAELREDLQADGVELVEKIEAALSQSR